MRVFILCTGRSGSVSFIKACKHIENFTSDHESLTSYFGDKRFDFPDQHIEADNRLSWQLGELDERFGDNAFYVHLKRNKEKVISSFENRFFTPTSIIDGYTTAIRMNPIELLNKQKRRLACKDYVNTVTSNIELFLKDKSNVLEIELEHIHDGFSQFWDLIGAEGNKSEALQSFNAPNNTSKSLKSNFLLFHYLLFKREVQYLSTLFKS